MGMNTSQHHHFVFGNGVNDQIGKSAENCTAQLTPEHLILVGISADGLHDPFDRIQEIIATSGRLWCRTSQPLRLSEAAHAAERSISNSSAPGSKPSSYSLPRLGITGISVMRSKFAIQLVQFLGRKRWKPLLRNTVP